MQTTLKIIERANDETVTLEHTELFVDLTIEQLICKSMERLVFNASFNGVGDLDKLSRMAFDNFKNAYNDKPENASDVIRTAMMQ
ncbi:hypothetical protein FCV82_02265 [Vibrio breoganii]|uniref:hypothetical protein n=1 Tax=Vibrio breoganii TaxID=553239 RepID=UPI000C823869|nr:hypothetical protein [Vibrio breoganii]PMN67122.1 hypothetical protein BCT28_03975 [Vibrio breoganii]PMO82901.1 hypothetical protein BCT00_06625 [Vibrio breoganii]TKF90417.1 hypothetical protein FCV82_02265 [Vibrio breoganii]